MSEILSVRQLSRTKHRQNHTKTKCASSPLGELPKIYQQQLSYLSNIKSSPSLLIQHTYQHPFLLHSLIDPFATMLTKIRGSFVVVQQGVMNSLTKNSSKTTRTSSSSTPSASAARQKWCPLTFRSRPSKPVNRAQCYICSSMNSQQHQNPVWFSNHHSMPSPSAYLQHP